MEVIRTVRAAELDTVRRRRAELREALGALEAATAAPTPGREPEWAEVVRGALGELADDFAAHIAVTEGPDGLHESILVGAPRLVHAVEQLTEEHVRIATDIAELVALCSPPITTAEVAVIREQSIRLMSVIMRHRQRGADLIYDAYETDIGGCD